MFIRQEKRPDSEKLRFGQAETERSSEDGWFLKRVTVGADGTFRATGLDPDKDYQLMVKVIGSNLVMQWVRHVEVLGFSISVPGREDAGAYAPGTAMSIVMNNGWLW